MMRRALRCGCLLFLSLVAGVRLSAHSGPPYPLFTDRAAGAYRVSVWTDPDATDDGSPGGQFWVVPGMAANAPLPPGTTVRLTVRPIEWQGAERSTVAEAVDGDAATRFAAVVLEREGRYEVSVELDGPAGRGVIAATVDATYDTRPPAGSLLVYLLPFVLAGGLWLKLLLARRSAGQP